MLPDRKQQEPPRKTPPESMCRRQSPAATRKPTKTAKSPDSAQPIEAAVKRVTAVTNSHRKVSTRVSHPVSGMAMISAIRYAV